VDCRIEAGDTDTVLERMPSSEGSAMDSRCSVTGNKAEVTE